MVPYIVGQWILRTERVVMVESAHNLISTLFEYQLHNPVSIEKVRVTLHDE